MTITLPENEEGSLTEESAEFLLKQTGNKILVMGMGLSRHEDSKAFVKKVLDHYNCPMVMDADALMALGELGERKKSSHPLILTPHPGEMARLLGWSIREVQEKRIQAVTEAAKKYDAVVVLKGNKTMIATPGGKLMVNLTGNCGNGYRRYGRRIGRDHRRTAWTRIRSFFRSGFGCLFSWSGWRLGSSGKESNGSQCRRYFGISSQGS